jgi:exopolysaccharide production protein ExoZ
MARMSGPDNAAHELNSGYVYGIDLVRFACAVGVAVYHLTAAAGKYFWVMPFGWIGVEVFFVISGFVIANSAHGATARQFVVGRFLRLYPTAWCAALFTFPLFLLLPGRHESPLLTLGLSLLLLHGPFLASAYWTLPIEISFYFLVYLMVKFQRFRNIQALAVILILWSAPNLIAAVLKSLGLVHWNWVVIGYGAENMLLLRHGEYFGLGIVVWLFKERRIGKLGFIVAGVALVLGYMEIYSRTIQFQSGMMLANVMPQTAWTHLPIASIGAFSAGFAAIVLSVEFNHLFPTNAVLRRTVRILGLMTYPFYLLHQRVGGYVVYQMKWAGIAPLYCILAGLICTGAVSLLIALYLEPALRSLLKSKIGALRPVPKNLVSEMSRAHL